jgi:hypothetical protein
MEDRVTLGFALQPQTARVEVFAAGSRADDLVREVSRRSEGRQREVVHEAAVADAF